MTPACECLMSTRNATLSSGCSKASWRVTANSPHWGLNPGPSVYKTDALPLSYRGFRFDDKLVRPTIYFGTAEMSIARRTHSLPRSPESQGMQEALNTGNSSIFSFLPFWSLRHCNENDTLAATQANAHHTRTHANIHCPIKTWTRGPRHQGNGPDIDSCFVARLVCLKSSPNSDGIPMQRCTCVGL